MTQTYGYCRITTPQQNLERQKQNILQRFPEAIIVEEPFLSAAGLRENSRSAEDLLLPRQPALARLLPTLQAGDALIFDSLSRFSDTAEAAFNLYQRLFQAGIRLCFLKEPMLDSVIFHTSLEQPGGHDASSLLSSLLQAQLHAAMEAGARQREELHRRTREGIAAAREQGKQIGRQPGAQVTVHKAAAIKGQIRKYSRDFEGSLNDLEVMALVGNVSRVTYYKYKKQLREADMEKDSEAAGHHSRPSQPHTRIRTATIGSAASFG